MNTDAAGDLPSTAIDGEPPRYRPEMRVLDCTIRDGGLMNAHHFEDRIVVSVHEACRAAGIDYMEIGYRASRKAIQAGEHGCWKYCLEEDIRRILGERTGGPKLSIMADAGKCDYREDISPKQDSMIDLVRIACYLHQIPLALDMVKDARDKGYEVTVNLMAVTKVGDSELDTAIALLAQSEADALYVVDSFGALLPSQTRRLVEHYLSHTRPHRMEVGIHAHNNLQLAYANTLEAITHGANYIDATMAGLGRGAGNCPMELLLGYFDTDKYDLLPVLQCVAEVIEPLRAELKWGFDLAYMITGLFNQHPRAAIAFNSADSSQTIREFYQRILSE